MDRAQELYSSMLLRGYDREFRYAAPPRFSLRDALYLVCSIAFFILLRFVNVSGLLGRLFVR